MIRANRLGVCCRISLFVILAAMICSCSDDDPARPKADPDPTYENIWPAAVGNHWEYEAVVKSYNQILPEYDRLEDVPPIPTMEELSASLNEQIPGEVDHSSLGVYHLEFAPGATTGPDSVVLVIETEMEFIEGYSWPPMPMVDQYSPGIIWTRTDGRTATYSENGLVWLYLEGGLTPGDEFEAQLHWGPVSEFGLKTRVWGIGPMELSGTTYSNVVECFYVLDMGYNTATGPGGEVTGISRYFIYGLIAYAPGVGPIYCKERHSYQGGLTERSIELQLFSRSN